MGIAPTNIYGTFLRAVAQELRVPYEIVPGAGLTLQMGINNESGICQAHLRGLYPGRGQPGFQDSGNGPGHEGSAADCISMLSYEYPFG